MPLGYIVFDFSIDPFYFETLVYTSDLIGHVARLAGTSFKVDMDSIVCWFIVCHDGGLFVRVSA